MATIEVTAPPKTLSNCYPNSSEDFIGSKISEYNKNDAEIQFNASYTKRI